MASRMADEDTEAQAEEIEVLQSIFDEQELRVVDVTTVELLVEIELPEDFKLCMRTRFEDGVDHEIAFSLKYLPPIVMTCTMPPDYPSTNPPSFKLSSSWLDAERLELLAAKLDDVWEDSGGGDVIIFDLATVLKDAAGELVEDGLFELSPTLGEVYESERVVPPLDGIETVFEDCLEYDNIRMRQVFFKGDHTCQVCFMDYPGDQFWMGVCNHAFCKECVASVIEVNIRGGSVRSIVCLAPDCKEPLMPSDVQSLVDDEVYAKYDERLLASAIESSGDMTYCPRDGCEQPVIVDGEECFGQCSVCEHAFCTKCRLPWHAGKCDAVADALRKAKGKGDEIKSILFIHMNTKACPTCGHAIEKNFGCNKMTCSMCHNYFCWSCGRNISGYDHFRGGFGCKLFPDNAQEERAPRHQRRPCVQCGQACSKENNNNHIACWNCKTNFCYLCSAKFQKPSQHFANVKGRCKQHSA